LEKDPSFTKIRLFGMLLGYHLGWSYREARALSPTVKNKLAKTAEEGGGKERRRKRLCIITTNNGGKSIVPLGGS